MADSATSCIFREAMIPNAQIWLVWGGVGLFLVGIYLMEKALGHLAGRNFKLLLRRGTSGNFRSMLSGIVSTALLQSSSVVSFLTLAFVGSGLVKLVNALAVVLGANIGTTLSNWIVTTLGFSLNLDLLWYLLLGACGILLVMTQGRKKWEQWLFFLIGFSFLFVALGMMKSGMASAVEQVDFTPYRNLPPVFFVVIGFVLTFLIQSSNATMAITLSALYASIIPFPLAASIVIGSELGTSIKMVLASAGGSAEKKQLATGNILLNLLTTIIALIFLYPLIHLIREIIGIKNPLHGLVAFQMAINLGAALIFFPFLHIVSRWLEKKYLTGNDRATLYIDAKVPGVSAFALEIFRLETFYFLKRVMAYHGSAFQLNAAETGIERLFTEKEKSRHFHQHDAWYADIKKAHGELIDYYVQMQKMSSHAGDLAQINQLMKSVHSAMYAAKGIKDINHNKDELLQSGNDVKYSQFSGFSGIVQRNLATLSSILPEENVESIKLELTNLLENIQTDYTNLLHGIYDKSAERAMPDKDISTLQNMNRELYASGKSLIYAAADYLLPLAEANEIRNLPLAIR